jgi:hypothetical protein
LSPPRPAAFQVHQLSLLTARSAAFAADSPVSAAGSAVPCAARRARSAPRPAVVRVILARREVLRPLYERQGGLLVADAADEPPAPRPEPRRSRASRWPLPREAAGPHDGPRPRRGRRGLTDTAGAGGANPRDAVPLHLARNRWVICTTGCSIAAPPASRTRTPSSPCPTATTPATWSMSGCASASAWSISGSTRTSQPRLPPGVTTAVRFR